MGSKERPLIRLRFVEPHEEVEAGVEFDRMVELAELALRNGELIRIDSPEGGALAFNPRHLVSIERLSPEPD